MYVCLTDRVKVHDRASYPTWHGGDQLYDFLSFLCAEGKIALLEGKQNLTISDPPVTALSAIRTASRIPLLQSHHDSRLATPSTSEIPQFSTSIQSI